MSDSEQLGKIERDLGHLTGILETHVAAVDQNFIEVKAAVSDNRKDIDSLKQSRSRLRGALAVLPLVGGAGGAGLAGWISRVLGSS